MGQGMMEYIRMARNMEGELILGVMAPDMWESGLIIKLMEWVYILG